jgi:thiamine-phosphate diphosphorylase/hydroxyethylthiazole kinase
MGNGFIDVIKGNEGEIKTVYDETSPSGASAQAVQQRGVDSTSVLSRVQKARLVLDLARRQGSVVVMTGKRDFVSDGELVVTVDNGHEYLGMVTGTGCVLATTVSAMVAVSPKEDRLLAVLAGILLFEIAAEVAAARPEVRGPGTFVPAFVDELARLRRLTAKGDVEWMGRAKVKKVFH